jgi:hypothetical protein
MSIDRRGLVAGLTAVGAVGLWSGGTAAQAVRVRRPISSLSPRDPDVVALRRAIPAMRRSGAWARQIALHADMSQRHHSSWRFLPWHRLQLLWFERQVARISGRPGFALPYWDWDDDKVPALFFDDPVFRLAGRDIGPADTISDYMRQNGQTFRGRITDPFDTFFGRPRSARQSATGQASGSAEWSGHNMLHGFVGGDMGLLDRSPNDPLFWMHHANIDRVWALWQEKHGSEGYPQAWRDEVLQGYLDTNGRVAPAVKAGSTIDTASFGYRYAIDPTPPLVFAAAPRKMVRQQSKGWMAAITSPQSALLIIPAADSDNGEGQAVGYLDVAPDDKAGTMITLTATRLSDNEEQYRDALFLVPSGNCLSEQTLRIKLDDVWSGGVTGGVRIDIKLGPLASRKASPTPTVLKQFVVDGTITYYAS